MAIELGPIRDILKKALQVEVDGHTFYTMAAERAEQPAVRDLFERLAHDEVEHKTYLKNVMRRLEELGADSFFMEPKDPGLAEYSSEIFGDEFRKQALGVTSAQSALSIGMQLETNAVTFFTSAADGSDAPQAKGFFRFLADWEGQHYRILERLLKLVQRDAAD